MLFFLFASYFIYTVGILGILGIWEFVRLFAFVRLTDARTVQSLQCPFIRFAHERTTRSA